MPEVIRTPGRDWTNLDKLEFQELVDPLDWAQEKDRVDAEGVDVLSWDDALDEHGDLIEEQFGSVVDPQRDYLTALSTALFSAGTVIYVPEGVAAEDVKIRTRMNSARCSTTRWSSPRSPPASRSSSGRRQARKSTATGITAASSRQSPARTRTSSTAPSRTSRRRRTTTRSSAATRARTARSTGSRATSARG